jgi:hypothetical protein
MPAPDIDDRRKRLALFGAESIVDDLPRLFLDPVYAVV